MVIGKEVAGGYLTDAEIEDVVRQAVDQLAPNGKRVLVLIPDGTRSMPVPLMFDLLEKHLAPRVTTLDYLVALGTHPPMTDEQLSRLVGRPVSNGKTGSTHVYNHIWNDPASFYEAGILPADLIGRITGGLMVQDVHIRINKLILDYNLILICGPVFPHEAVGFSGGNKYFFPGIAGQEIIFFIHWLGALITNFQVVGTLPSPMREVIEQAAGLINREKACFALVTTSAGTAGIYFGDPFQAWQAAVPLSAQRLITYVDRPFQTVLAVMPEMYDDLWTAGKGMYKQEPVAADGGEVIIYAPHVTEVSYMHGKLIDQVGYHCRDYFVKQWSRFKDFPRGILAHSTLVKGLGTYDEQTGIEIPRVQVTLATGIPEERCRRINLGYRDPASIRIGEWLGREPEGIFVVPHAGEMLYRVRLKEQQRDL
jgi:nickel-dependent lactate racemase